jgi:hypothetical protein
MFNAGVLISFPHFFFNAVVFSKVIFACVYIMICPALL